LIRRRDTHIDYLLVGLREQWMSRIMCPIIFGAKVVPTDGTKDDK
jgi:hypothetical protein